MPIQGEIQITFEFVIVTKGAFGTSLNQSPSNIGGHGQKLNASSKAFN